MIVLHYTPLHHTPSYFPHHLLPLSTIPLSSPTPGPTTSPHPPALHHTPLLLSTTPPPSSSLRHRIKGDGSNLIQDRKYHLHSYHSCFVAREFVDWLISKGEAHTRQEAVQIGMQLVDAGVFRHGMPDIVMMSSSCQ